MKYMIELNDLDREGHSVIVPVSKVGATIRGWYGSPTAMTEDDVKIDELHEALNEEDYETARDIAAELGVGFDHVQVSSSH
jgi:hypothetical protein